MNPSHVEDIASLRYFAESMNFTDAELKAHNAHASVHNIRAMIEADADIEAAANAVDDAFVQLERVVRFEGGEQVARAAAFVAIEAFAAALQNARPNAVARALGV